MSTSINYNEILKKLNILYLEDENVIRENIKKVLELLCNKVYAVENITNAKEILNSDAHIDIVISDINLQDSNGIDFIKMLRHKDKNLPVILISAYTNTEYLLEATKLKLIDYLTKPVDFKTLNATLLKCVDDIIDNARYAIKFNDEITYNVIQKRLFIKNEELFLTSKELALLDYLIKNSNRVVSHEEIKSTLWEDEFEATDSALKNLLNKLRKKIGKDTIVNISGVGFRIEFLK